jgi:hypothetical protein
LTLFENLFSSSKSQTPRLKVFNPSDQASNIATLQKFFKGTPTNRNLSKDLEAQELFLLELNPFVDLVLANRKEMLEK